MGAQQSAQSARRSTNTASKFYLRQVTGRKTDLLIDEHIDVNRVTDKDVVSGEAIGSDLIGEHDTKIHTNMDDGLIDETGVQTKGLNHRIMDAHTSDVGNANGEEAGTTTLKAENFTTCSCGNVLSSKSEG